ncbi:MAG TPA: hypothetical protein VGH28_11200 [Polyangiaceae bacterium]
MKLSQGARRIVAAAIVAVGCGVGLSIWALAAPEAPNPLEEYEQSKRYDAELQRVGGKSAVFGAELSSGIASLFRGGTLGLTICGLSLFVAGGFFYFTRARGGPPKEA